MRLHPDGHYAEHCSLPWLWYRREGHVWACDCGQMYRVTWVYAMGSGAKIWERFTPAVSSPTTEGGDRG